MELDSIEMPDELGFKTLDHQLTDDGKTLGERHADFLPNSEDPDAPLVSASASANVGIFVSIGMVLELWRLFVKASLK